MPTFPRSSRSVAGVAAAIALVVVACAGPTGGPAGPGSTASGTQSASAVALRLGYFPNITHATAIVGVETGIFAKALGPRVRLETATFNAGSSAIEALLSNAIDASYIGPNPAINAFAKSHGEAIRIVAGATSGGAALVVRPEINGPADLKGRKLATPQLGNTQDVALRTWLTNNGLTTDTQGGGDVSIQPQDNSQTLEAFIAGQIDGAWVPEPWATRLVLDGKGKVLVDEKTVWPEGRFVTTHLIVRTDYLQAHRNVVEALLEGDLAANDAINADPARAQEAANAGIEKITGKMLASALISAAWPHLTFTVDPIASSLATSAANATRVGLLDPVELHGIYDLTLLNELLRSAGRPEVAGS